MPTLADRYELAEIVYSDAQVVAYRAHDQLLNRAVTLELLQAQPGAAPYTARLLEKARRAALINLPHVAALYDQHALDGRPFLVWEEPLGPALAEIAPLPVEQAVALVQALAKTVRTARERRTALPALNPHTIRIAAGERVQVLDLGFEQAGADESSATQRLGQILAAALATTDVGPLHAIAERAEQGRYQTLDGLLDDLRQAQAHAADSTTVVPRALPTIPIERQPEPDDQPTVQPRARRGWLWLVGLVVGGVVLALLLSPLLRSTNSATAEPPSATASGAPSAVNGPAASTAGGPVFIIATNNGQALVVRKGPGRDFERITSLPNGSTVEVLEGSQSADGFNWVRIRAGTVEGWCVREALRER